jgi:ligand-binding sensor domain-containing protein/DNA-binding CsgD family transcriptional regulator
MTRFILLLLAWQVWAIPGRAQSYPFSHLTVDDGLSNNSVISICQDSRGFMWFGTYHGLNKYDGHHITPYLSNPRDSSSISDNSITCLYQDRRQTLWVGTHLGGLNRYDQNRDAFVRYSIESRPPYRLSGNRITCIFEDRRGRLWVGTEYGLNLLERGARTFRQFRHHPQDPTSLNNDYVYAVIENEQDEVLVLTINDQLNRYQPATGTFAPVDVGGEAGRLRSARMLTQDQRGQYWAGTFERGLLRFGRGPVRTYRHQPADARSLSRDQVKALLPTRRGELWVGTDGGGVDVFDPVHDGFLHLRTDDETPGSLSSNAVHSLYEDRAGTVWVGTFGGGVNYYSPYHNRFAHYTHLPRINNSIGHRSVLALHQAPDGRVWVGTDGGGLDVFDPLRRTFRHFRHDPNDPHSLSADVVKTLFQDRQGTLWVGTYLGGLNRYDPARGRFERYVSDPANPHSLASNLVWDIYEDRRGQLWVSTLGGGMCLMDRARGTFTRFRPLSGPGSLSDYNVVTMLEDRTGQLWVGTEDHGLNLYHPQTNTFSYVQHDKKKPSSLSSNRIQVLFEDSRGRFWVGTADAGLNLLDRRTGTFRRFTTRQGLPSNIINSIVEDRAGQLWIGTNQGLARFDAAHGRFKIYTREDGLQSNEFGINAALRARSGELYFGGVNGFNVFVPEELTSNPAPPTVVLTGLLVFNEPVRAGQSPGLLRRHITEADTLTLSYREAAVTFQFAALNFIAPQKNRYAYRLDGFDTKWRSAGARHEATYTNLDPGTYTFRARAANNDGVWNLRGAALTVVVTPPWWKTAWFRVLAGVLGWSGIMAVYIMRTSRLRRQMHQEKLRELSTKEAELREARLKHEKELVEMSRARLETEILTKNSKLASSVMNTVHQNEALLTIKDQLKGVIADLEHEQRKRIQRVVRQIEHAVTPDQHWSHFEELFNQLHENFLQRLKATYPQLTSRDIKLCAYLRMNLNSKETATLMGVSARGAEDLRYRVRKKMGLNTTTNLAEFILLM